MPNLTITIDGPAGSGKSSLARPLSPTLGYLYLYTAALHRAPSLKEVRREYEVNAAGKDIRKKESGLRGREFSTRWSTGTNRTESEKCIRSCAPGMPCSWTTPPWESRKPRA